jgi:hypothetical protein
MRPVQLPRYQSQLRTPDPISPRKQWRYFSAPARNLLTPKRSEHAYSAGVAILTNEHGQISGLPLASVVTVKGLPTKSYKTVSVSLMSDRRLVPPVIPEVRKG